MNDRSDHLPPLIRHGGNLAEAVRQYNIAREHWCDLSTGVNPYGYPVPAIDPQAWLRLPDDDDDLEAIAARHYGAHRALAVAGTQAAIRMLPQLLERGTIAIHALTYGEYAPAFAHAGFPVERFSDASLDAMLATSDGQGPRSLIADSPFAGEAPWPRIVPGEPLPAHWRHLVIVNPNNPTTMQFDAATLRDWHLQLASRGGTLIVDEAFADATAAQSVAAFTDEPGLVVLRSVGKFFGLAGARAGFVLAHSSLLDAAVRLRGPWTVSGPARAAVRAALLDTAWHTSMRMQLERESARLGTLLESFGLCVYRTPLFAWIPDPRAPMLHERLAKTGVWVRKFDQIPSLRIGLPANEAGWKALTDGLRAALA